MWVVIGKSREWRLFSVKTRECRVSVGDRVGLVTFSQYFLSINILTLSSISAWQKSTYSTITSEEA